VIDIFCSCGRHTPTANEKKTKKNNRATSKSLKEMKPACLLKDLSDQKLCGGEGKSPDKDRSLEIMFIIFCLLLFWN